jgi:hypothetical protein
LTRRRQPTAGAALVNGEPVALLDQLAPEAAVR